MGIIIAFVILGVIIVGIVSGGVAIYNRLVMLKYNVDKNFANIDVILKQRVDEIPNLMAKPLINSLICYTSVLGIIASLILLCHIEYRDGELQINLPFGNKGISSGQYGYILPSNQEKTIIFKHQ